MTSVYYFHVILTRGHLWSLVVIRGHSWSLVCTFRHDPTGSVTQLKMICGQCLEDQIIFVAEKRHPVL